MNDPLDHEESPGLSRLWQCLDTRITDLLSGNIRPRGDHHEVLTASNLSPELQTALGHLLQQSSIWPSRRYSLAEEIVGACQQRIDAGVSSAELARTLEATPVKPRGLPWLLHLTQRLNFDLPPTVLRLLDDVTDPIQSRKLHAAATENLSACWTSVLERGVSVDTLHEHYRKPKLVGELVNQLKTPDVAWTMDVPHEITATIHRVVSATRLWPSEKRDILRELTEHFRCGIEAGVTPSDLLADFGDPRVAAKLIRRAKRRCRAWYWHTWIRSLQLTWLSATCCVAAWLVLVAWMSAKPNVKLNLVEGFDRKSAQVDAKERAWPRYREGLLKLELGPEYHQITNDVYENGSRGERWTEAVKLVDFHAESIACFERAARVRHLGFQFTDSTNADWLAKEGFVDRRSLYDEDEALVRLPLPHTQGLGTAANLLLCAALQAENSGDIQRATELVANIIRIADHVAQTSDFWVSRHLGRIHLKKAVEELTRIIAEHPETVSLSQLQELSRIIEISQLATQMKTLDISLPQDLVQRIYTDDGEGDGHITAAGLRLLCDADRNALLWTDLETHPLSFLVFSESGVADTVPESQFQVLAPFVATRIASRREIAQIIDGLAAKAEADMAVPFWQYDRSEFSAAFEQLRSDRTSTIRYAPAILACGYWNDLVTDQKKQSALDTNRMEGWRVFLALQQYQHEHQSWPKSLVELVNANLLPQLPIDQFDGKPLKYRLTEGQPRLYSVGTDRDDDSGEMLYYDVEPNASTEHSDGDWSLLPEFPRQPTGEE